MGKLPGEIEYPTPKEKIIDSTKHKDIQRSIDRWTDIANNNTYNGTTRSNARAIVDELESLIVNSKKSDDFDEKDFKGSGQLLTTSPKGSKIDAHFCCKVGYMIHDNKRLMFIVSLSDGCCALISDSKKELAEKLNNSDNTYRPLTDFECLTLGETMPNRFKK